MSQRDDDIHALAIYTANAMLNELDRGSNGPTDSNAQLIGGQSLSSGLDRDFYAREVAADLDSTPKRIRRALAVAGARPMLPQDSDLAAYAQSVGADPNDQDKAEEAWATGWAEMAGNLCTRALHLIETTNGPVEKRDPLELLGIVPPADD